MDKPRAGRGVSRQLLAVDARRLLIFSFVESRRSGFIYLPETPNFSTYKKRLRQEREGSVERNNISSGTPWEPIVGYSRAVRVGRAHSRRRHNRDRSRWQDRCEATPTRKPCRRSRISKRALVRAGASLKDVVRTRVFLTNIADWQEVGKAHGEFFREIRPASTMMAVSALVAPEMLLEIEADAIVA